MIELVLTVGYDPTLPSPQLSVLPLSLSQDGILGETRTLNTYALNIVCLPIAAQGQRASTLELN